MRIQLHLKQLLLLLIVVASSSVWGQTTLPHNRTLWGITPIGWTETLNSNYSTSFACSGNDGAKFDSNQIKIVQLASAPDVLNFVVKSNNAASTSTLLVQESDNNSTFTQIVNLTGTTGLPTTCSTKGPYQLKNSTRYIKWTFTKGSSNMTMDDVSITASSNAPSLSITPTTTNLGTSCVGIATSSVQYTITNNGTVAATNVAVASSGTNSSDFIVSGLSSTSIPASGGTATYNVTFTPSSVGAKSATVATTSTGSNSPSTLLTGTGSNAALTVTTPTSSAITATSAILGGNITVSGCNTITERGIYYSSTSNFVDGVGTKVSETGTFSTGIFTKSTTGLSSGTVYYFKAFATSNGVNTYSSQGSFITPTLPVTVPYSQNFEGTTNEWTLDTAGTNKWSIGSATNNGGTKALYISNDGGTTNEYTTTSTQSGTNASVRVDLTGLTNATLSFDWKSNGEANSTGTTFYDFGEVYINTGASDILISNANEFYNSTVFALRTIDLTPYVGQIITLKFKWKNDSSAGSQPPFSVDNVSIVPFGLPAFTTAAITNLNYYTATSGGTITNNGGSAITARGVVYATTTNPTLLSNVVNSGSGNGTYTSNLTGLLSNTLYYLRAFVTNTNGTSYGNQITFTTNSIIAPTALEESLVMSAGFTANWNAIAGATAYELDVFTLNSVQGTTSIEDFSNIPAPSSSYSTRTWTGVGSISWTATEARTDQEITSGNKAITLGKDGNATLKSGVILTGVTNITFNVQEAFSSGTLIVKILSGADFTTTTTVGTISYGSTVSTFNSGVITGINSSYKISIENNNTGRATIDNLSITSSATLTSNFVQGYENLNVGNVTSYLVTNLDAETTYFYRVRAKNGNSTSVNSNVIEVTTTAPAAITWDGSAWSNTSGPTELLDAIIVENYNETAVITAKNLTINTGKVLTIQPTNTLTVAGNLTNEGSIIFQSDATGTASFAAYTGVAIAGSGTSTVERYIPANRAWRVLTAPLTGTTANTIADNWQGTNGEGVLLFSPSTVNSIAMVGYTTGGNAPNIKKYSAGWQNITNLTTEPMFGAAATDTKAFLVFPTGASNSTNIATGEDATTLRPKGQLIIGDITHTGLAENTFYALANPYASPINPVSLVSENPGQKLWLVNPSMGNFGAYVTFDGTDWSLPTPTGNDAYIQSGQGFFVRSATATSFSIKESDKVAGSSNIWFAKNATTSTTNPDKIRVLLYKQLESEWKLADGILSVNYADGSNDVDAMDTNKLSNFNESMMFRNNTTNLSIEHRSLPLATEIQPLRLTGTTAIAYQLRVKTENYSNSLLIPVLEDTLNGTFIEIPADGSEILIPFTGIVSTSTNPDNRFRIVYQTNLSNVDESALVASVYPNPVVNNELHINFANNISAAYTITNLLGQSIQTGKLVNTQNVITLNGANQGFYVLSITKEGKSFTTKIYVQ